MLSRLQEIYPWLVVLASPVTSKRSVEVLHAAGVIIGWQADESHGELGSIRRAALAQGLAAEAAHFHLCDWDRAIHWVEHYPDELKAVVAAIRDYDCLILGRTERAFASHPRVQRDTELVINHCFGLIWGEALDVTAASRGLSRRAAEQLVAGCDEPTIGNDAVWPLFLRQYDELRIDYLATEGLEWETPDRYAAEIAAVGGYEAWLTRHDADLHHWAERLQLAQVEVEALARWSDHLNP